MPRVATFWITSVLVLSALTITPASATTPLVADAGDSALSYNGEGLSLLGAARGGAAPYGYAWSWPGDPARLANATSAQASFDSAGLAPQDIVFTLTVTDDDGTVTSDAVRHRVDAAPILARRTIAVVVGVPDEVVGQSFERKTAFFTVPAGLARFTATLDWTDTVVPNDLDMEIVDPNGAVVSGTQGITGAKPERIVIDAPMAGAWTARVMAFLSAPTTGTVTIQGFPQGSMPALTLGGPHAFGRLDPQALVASVSGGAAPVDVAWDFDADGLTDATGLSASPALGVGEHVVRARATDAAGFEVSASTIVRVKEADTILRLRCGGDPTTPFWTMEFTSTKGSCWIHGGHHTYFMGDGRYALRAASGHLFTVEQQLSPPTEFLVDSPGDTPLHFEVSEDGITWTEVAHGEYRFLPALAEGDTTLQERQRVDVTATGAGQPFRFLRIAEPLSAAQGLSGYLDHSEFDVEADVLAAPAPPTLAAGVRPLACATDILEDFFLTHPCWFGGLNRWDAASFWHTYPLGDGAELDRIQGTFTLAPWRLDDWNDGDVAANRTKVSARVQTSVDGVHWDDVGLVATTFGTPTAFDIALNDAPARFVRLFPEYHARFDQAGEFAPNHHAKGFFVDSALVVTGLLPS